MGSFERKKPADKSKKAGKSPALKSATATSKDGKAGAGKKAAKPSKEKTLALLDEKQVELLEADTDRGRAQLDWHYAHSEAAELKKLLEKKQALVNQIIGDIRNIKAGNYTPSLFGPEGQAANGTNGKAESNGQILIGGQPLDIGATKLISDLIEFGMTDKKCEALVDQVGGNTIGALEKFQREHTHWNLDLKGFKEEWITKLQDAHEQLRRRFPMPDPSVTVEVKGDVNGTFPSLAAAADAIVADASEKFQAEAAK